MERREVEIRLKEGLEARPVAMLVQIASQFSSNIYFESGDYKVNAKSIMGMMSLGLLNGARTTVVTDGEDEVTALEKIEKFLKNESE